jgi:hypothetical protein
VRRSGSALDNTFSVKICRFSASDDRRARGELGYAGRLRKKANPISPNKTVPNISLTPGSGATTEAVNVGLPAPFKTKAPSVVEKLCPGMKSDAPDIGPMDVASE